MSSNADPIVLVSGNSDFVPAVRDLIDDGYKVEVVFWDQISKEPRDVAARFISLNQHLEYLSLNRSCQ